MGGAGPRARRRRHSVHGGADPWLPTLGCRPPTARTALQVLPGAHAVGEALATAVLPESNLGARAGSGAGGPILRRPAGPDAGYEPHLRHVTEARGRILFVTASPLYPPIRGTSARVAAMVRYFHEHGS